MIPTDQPVKLLDQPNKASGSSPMSAASLDKLSATGVLNMSSKFPYLVQWSGPKFIEALFEIVFLVKIR